MGLLTQQIQECKNVDGRWNEQTIDGQYGLTRLYAQIAQCVLIGGQLFP